MIDFLFGGTLHSDGELFFLQSDGIIVAALMGATIRLGLLLYKRSGEKNWFEEAIMFFFALSILVFVISDPQWISQSGSSATGKFAVVIDNSMSMDIRDKRGTRAQQALEILDKIQNEIEDRKGFLSSVMNKINNEKL